MTIACYLEPQKPKSAHWMRAFAIGCGATLVRTGEPHPIATEHVVMGNWPVAERIVRLGQPYWYLDSEYLRSPVRMLRVERGRFWPEFHVKHSMDRAAALGIALKPWRRDGRHVLVCLQGEKFGRPWGIDIAAWHATIEARVRAATDRLIILREKPYSRATRRAMPSFEEHLADAWCLVTHSSTAAVAAAIGGVPVFCEPTCAAAVVGSGDLARIETPLRPDREAWLAALAWRQWAADEMRSGEAWAYLRGAA